jgi:acyl-CoA oxidase
MERTNKDDTQLHTYHGMRSNVDHRRVSRKLQVLAGHVAPLGEGRDMETSQFSASPTFSLSHKSTLHDWIVRDNREMRRAIFDFLDDPLYRPNYYSSLEGFRELTMQRVVKFVRQGFFSVRDYERDPLKFQAALESLSFCDYSMAIKSGVHFTLCGGTIVKLGTAKHHATFLDKMDTLELPGCFGMTELGHGSNVMGIETTAAYDPGSDTFVIHTPTNDASKFWIGGAGSTAKICAVFAQLTIKGVWQGPHVFVVRLRDDAGNILPGVRIKDNGPKQGLNGVDNGQIWFDHYKVPRDSLLDKYASVDGQGNYSSPIADPQQRFGTMVSGLTTGRMLIAQAAVDACKSGVTITLRYSCTRPQFGQTPIIEYITQQRRIIPALATTYAMHLSMLKCKNIGVKKNGGGNAAKQIHVLSSGLKAAATWHRVRILQECRECCGGMGFLAANKIGPMLNDMNVDVTFEGDNTVMMQQVAKSLIDRSMSGHLDMPVVDYQNLGLGCIGNLLSWRCTCLTRAAAMEMQKSPKQSAYESNMDLIVDLGWASVDAETYTIFSEELASVPHEWKSTMEKLCMLYGLHRVEAGMTTYLEHGALPGQAVPSIRHAINSLCTYFVSSNASVALSLCDAFGIPDHLLQAPIAVDTWHNIGQ